MREEEVELHYEVPGRARIYIKGKTGKMRKSDIYKILSAVKEVIDYVLYNRPPDPVLAYKLRKLILSLAANAGLNVKKLKIETVTPSASTATNYSGGGSTTSGTSSSGTESSSTSSSPTTGTVFAD